VNSNRKIRIALIGLGDIAQKAYLPIVAAHQEVQPVLCTRDEETLRQLAETYRIEEKYSDIDTLIAARPDAAMIHAASEAHHGLATKLLAAGIPIFVDKPLAYELAHTEEILALAEAQNRAVYVGFNRRFAPLITSLGRHEDVFRVDWQKHRVAQPGEARSFVMDDFIHVLDGLRFLGGDPDGEVEVFCRKANGLLEAIDVRWTSGNTLVTGSMNRVAGRAEEVVRVNAPNQTWTVRELSSGRHARGGEEADMGFGNWTPTLAKRGFETMIEDWLAVAREGNFSLSAKQDILATHALCEGVLGAIGD